MKLVTACGVVVASALSAVVPSDGAPAEVAFTVVHVNNRLGELNPCG